MSLNIGFLLVALSLGLSVAEAAEAAEAESWLVGTWQKTQDEDKSPDDVMKFNENGTWVAYGPECQEKLYEYFLHKGDVFLVIPIQKGPISLIFRPNSDKKQLTFTSPRTMNNAVYEKVEKPLCGEQK